MTEMVISDVSMRKPRMTDKVAGGESLSGEVLNPKQRNDQKICTRHSGAAWSNRLTSNCYTRTIRHEFGYAKSPV